MRDLIGTLTDSLYNGDNQDEYLIMKNLLTKHIDSTDTYNVHVDSVINKETAENLLVEVRSMAGTLPFMLVSIIQLVLQHLQRKKK